MLSQHTIVCCDVYCVLCTLHSIGHTYSTFDSPFSCHANKEECEDRKDRCLWKPPHKVWAFSVYYPECYDRKHKTFYNSFNFFVILLLFPFWSNKYGRMFKRTSLCGCIFIFFLVVKRLCTQIVYSSKLMDWKTFVSFELFHVNISSSNSFGTSQAWLAALDKVEQYAIKM